MIKYLSLALVLLLGTPALAAEEPDHAIHEELRGLLRGIEQAINSEKYGDLGQYFHEKLRITTINQELISSRPEIETYFNRWFGPGGYLKSLKMSLEADALTELYGDNTFGVVRGSGKEDYQLSDDRYFPMETRWTATVVKDTDGKWRILALHIGTNFLDNPVLAAAESSVKYFAAGGLAVGLLLGILISFVWRRRKPAI